MTEDNKKAARIGKSGAAHTSLKCTRIVVDQALVDKALDRLLHKRDPRLPLVRWRFFAGEDVGWLEAGITTHPSLKISDLDGNAVANLALYSDVESASEMPEDPATLSAFAIWLLDRMQDAVAGVKAGSGAEHGERLARYAQAYDLLAEYRQQGG